MHQLVDEVSDFDEEVFGDVVHEDLAGFLVLVLEGLGTVLTNHSHQLSQLLLAQMAHLLADSHLV